MQPWSPERREAEVEIRSLVQRYNALGDSGRFDEFVELFTSDVHFEVDGIEEPFIGEAGIRRLADQARSDLLGWKPDTRVFLRHFTSTHLIEHTDEGQATGSLYYECLMPHGLDHWGRYHDRYRRVDAVWLIAERRERRDGMVDDGWAASLWGPGGVRVR